MKVIFRAISNFILDIPIKRKNWFWEISLQISPRNAMEMFYTILESNLVGKKSEKKFDPLGGIFTPLPEKIGKKTAKMA